LPDLSWVEVAHCGDGDELVDVLVVPGIFESIQLARAYAARLRVDTESGVGCAAELCSRYSFVFRSVIPPGYEDHAIVQELLPGGAKLARTEVLNETYRARLRVAEAERPTGARTVNIHHSWGGGMAAPTWTEEDRRRPELTILSAPAWSDCVKASARFGAEVLAIPVLRSLSTLVVPLSLLPLYRTKIDEIRDLARGMPAGFSSYDVAHASYRQVRKNPALYDDNPLIELSGEQVVLCQGRKDSAVNGPKALEKYRRRTASVKWKERVTLLEFPGDHWPLLESAETLCDALRLGGL